MLKSQRGFAPIIFLLAILVVSGGIVGGSIYYKANFENENKLVSNNPIDSTKSSGEKNITKTPTFQETTTNGDYCTMKNGCPKDKCNIATQCGAGGLGFGCAPGETTCEYKDLNLKDKYREVTINQVKSCVTDFISKNQYSYPTLKVLKIDDNQSGKESSTCDSLLQKGSNFNKEDRYCWYISMQHKTDPSFPLETHFYVGAQTCSVYWNLPDSFKNDLPSLNKVEYSPDQAIVCAENYIEANKGKYLEYKNFVKGFLEIPNKAPGMHGRITDFTKDSSFYTVIDGNIYLVVGAHSCTVYGVNEQYYTKL